MEEVSSSVEPGFDGGNSVDDVSVSNNDSGSDKLLVEAIRKVKVDGKEIEIPIEDLEKAYELSSASNKRFEEASKLRKEVDSFLDHLSNGDLSILAEFVPEDRLAEFAEGLLRKKVEWEETSEETRARILAERERDELRDKLNEYTTKQQEQIKAYVNDQAAMELDNDITEVIEELEKTHGSVVKSPEFIQDIARVMLAQLESGAGSMSARKAADLAYKTWQKRIGTYVRNVSYSDLEKYFSKDQLKAFRKAQLDNAMGQFPEGKKSKGTPKKKPHVNVNNFFDHLEKQFG